MLQDRERVGDVDDGGGGRHVHLLPVIGLGVSCSAVTREKPAGWTRCTARCWKAAGPTGQY